MRKMLDLSVLALALAAASILIIGAALAATVGADGPTTGAQLARYFAADGEANLWAWYSSLVLSLVAAGFLLLAAQTSEARGRLSALLLAGIALVMSLDEATVLHERLRYAAAAFTTSGYAWLIIGIPLAVVVAIIAIRTAASLSYGLRRELVLAGAVYAAGAIGFELLGGLLADGAGVPTGSPLLLLETTIEEALEAAGALLALRSVLRRVTLTQMNGAARTVDVSFSDRAQR